MQEWIHLHTDKHTERQSWLVDPAGAMTLHAATVSNAPCCTHATLVKMPTKPTLNASAAATQRVRECKAELFRTLQRRHRDAWRTYWTTFQQYLMAKQSLEQFHSIAESLLGPENIKHHNAFVVALLQDCSIKEESIPDYQGDSGVSTAGSEESNGDNAVKLENGAQEEQHDVHDTESAELLMGLGRFVGH